MTADTDIGDWVLSRIALVLLYKVLEFSVICTLQLCYFVSSLIKVKRWPGCNIYQDTLNNGREHHRMKIKSH
jgi:hypothetical protein